MFRDAFNKVQNTGSNRDFGTTKAARMYFSMSEPSPKDKNFAEIDVKAPSFKQKYKDNVCKKHCLFFVFVLYLIKKAINFHKTEGENYEKKNAG